MKKRLLPLLLLLPIAATAPAGDMGVDTGSLERLPDAEWTVDAAAHLLRRAGFGGTLSEIREFHALGLDGAVDRLFGWDKKIDPHVPPAPITVTSRPGREQYMQATTQEERQRIRREYTRKDRLQYAAVREWWTQAMARTQWPLRERMVLFWHGHFTSSYRDVRNSYHMFIQNTLFRRHAAGSFRELLHEISKDPAMLEYLDNNRNRKAAPNENYAREVMELFALGLGNYTERDIREGARALTGWTFAGNRFYFDERQHDEGKKTIFGRTGNFDGGRFLDLILEQPACSRFVAAKLFRYFAHDFASKAVVEGLARTLRRSDWQLEPVLRRLFKSQAFYSPYARATKIKSPVELVVGLYRSLGMDTRNVVGMSFLAQSLGQGLMDPPNVKGWPGGRAWITTSTLLSRYNLAGGIVGLPLDKRRSMQSGGREMRYARLLQRMRRVDPNGEEMEDMDDTDMDGGMAPRRRGRRGRRAVAPTYNVLATVRRHDLHTADEVVDFFTKTLLAVPASDDVRRSLLEYLHGDGEFDPAARDARQRLHGLLRLIVSTPEFQLT